MPCDKNTAQNRHKFAVPISTRVDESNHCLSAPTRGDGGTRDPSQVPTPSTSCPNPLPRAIFRRSGSQVWGGILFGRRCGVLHSLTLTEWFRKENCKIDNSLWSQKLILRKLHIIRSLFAYFSSSPALYPIVRSIPTLFLSFNIFLVND